MLEGLNSMFKGKFYPKMGHRAPFLIRCYFLTESCFLNIAGLWHSNLPLFLIKQNVLRNLGALLLQNGPLCPFPCKNCYFLIRFSFPKFFRLQILNSKSFLVNQYGLTHFGELLPQNGPLCPFRCKNCYFLKRFSFLKRSSFLEFLRSQILNLRSFLANLNVLTHFGKLLPQYGPLCPFHCNNCQKSFLLMVLRFLILNLMSFLLNLNVLTLFFWSF